MKHLVSELTGPKLDQAVALAINYKVELCSWRPSTTWAQCGPLLYEYGVWLSDDAEGVSDGPYTASAKGGMVVAYGSTYPIAICRAIVTAEFGVYVELEE